MKRHSSIVVIAVGILLLYPLCAGTAAEKTAVGSAKASRRAAKAQTPPPTHPPLQAVEIATLPAGQERTDVFLLLGQSNMKGRGIMPDEPARDPRIVMMHLKDDRWYVARHPLHLGDFVHFDTAAQEEIGRRYARQYLQLNEHR